ncbi:hypothetical protein [Mucilaginibacter sp. CAU 1740]|uniref:hypothetical protein n=1 Tax=Mucilaginibacter sp. CAU 1740 TaxID=3140365 RepID=UPI00325AA33D
MILDIKVPDSSIAREAEEFARSVSSDVLFNHVMRCYYFGELFAKQRNAKIDHELMFVSSVLHDLGFTEAGHGPNRFEIEGAHAARNFLLERGVPDERTWQVWHNIALHVGDMNLFKDEATRIMQFGILYDLTALPPEISLNPKDVAEILYHYPRVGFKRGFLEVFEKELDSKQPYPHRFHLCSCIEHHRTGTLAIPKPEDFLGSAPFDE